MKTKLITGLKKEVLVIELPEYTKSWEFIDGHFWIDDKKTFIKGFSPFHKLLGKRDEISEEDVLDLVERTGLGNPSYSGEWYECYKNPDAMYSKATDSFNSALEKNIFWVNPEPYPSPYDPRIKTGRFEHGEELEKAERVWKEAQEKTFDRNRTLIFVKD